MRPKYSRESAAALNFHPKVDGRRQHLDRRAEEYRQQGPPGPNDYRCDLCGRLLFRSTGGDGEVETTCQSRRCRHRQTVALRARRQVIESPPVKPRREEPAHEARWREWLADPADFMRVMEEKWRAMASIRARERAEMAIGLRWDVLSRDGFRCRYCGTSVDDGAVLHVDHVVPVSKGGPTTMENLVTACIDCNLGKRDKSLTEESIIP